MTAVEPRQTLLGNHHVLHTSANRWQYLWRAVRRLSRLLVIGADASPGRPAEARAEGRGRKRLMVVFAVGQITPDSACRGVARARPPHHPPVPQMLQEAVLRGR